MMLQSHRWFPILWCLVLLTLELCVYPSNAQIAVLSVIEDLSRYQRSNVTLVCGGDQGEVTFFNRVGNVTKEVRTDENTAITVNILTFLLKPEDEGIYFCQIGSITSNELLLVAYPFPDASISHEYHPKLGDDLVVNCTIPVGNLHGRYSISWFKGVSEIDVSSAGYEHVSIENFALVFRKVKASDDSRGYYCVVNVSRRTENVTRQGSTIAVNVLAPLKMTSFLSGVSVAAGRVAIFTCRASGVPAAEFRWLLNGTEHIIGVTNSSRILETTIQVESTLTLSEVVEAQTGAVTCVAFHSNSGEIVTVTSTTNLVVLTNNFTVGLTVEGGQIHMRGTLPVFITGFFFIRVRFHNDGLLEESLISDPSFKDTNQLNVVIPKEKLPNFQEFLVTVAIESDGVTGPFTSPSNRTKMPSGIRVTDATDMCDCEKFDPSGSSSNTVVVVLSVLIILMIMVIALLMVGCIVFYCKRRMLYKASSEYSYSPNGSLRRSVSCNSYRSQNSHHSCYSSKSISSKSSGSSGPQSVYSESPSIKVNEVPEVEKEEERDVRNYETIDHKVLKQIEGRRIHYQDQHNKKPRLGGSCDDIAPAQMELQPVFPNTHTVPSTHVTEPQPVFPNTHTGATNRLAVYRVKRDSNSSFEDLEDECHLEFSTTVPRYS